MPEYSSKYIAKAVEEISRLPGIGKKTALRLALHLLKQPREQTHMLSESLLALRDKTRYCNTCHNISDEATCAICNSHRRDHSVICVVEDTRDVMAIENTAQFTGVYHVLGGVISPMDGIGPDQLNIESLTDRVKNSDEIKEIIFALSPTMEGDTTCFYLTKKLNPLGIKITSIARGVPIGGDLEYTDEITLGRSIMTRTPYEQ